MSSSKSSRNIGLLVIATMYWWTPIANEKLFGYKPSMDSGSIAIIGSFLALFIFSEWIYWPNKAKKR